MSLKSPAIFLSFALFLNYSCGQKNSKKEDGNTEQLQLTPSEQLIGKWSGIYRGLVDGKPFGDPQEVTVLFKAEELFQIALVHDQSAQVEGTWREFQGKTILLSIQKSTLPRVASAGKLIEPSYELSGQSLKIATDSFELKVTKPQLSNNSSSANKADPGLPGSWECNSKDHHRTFLQVSEPDDFKLSLHKPGERILIVRGKINPRNESTVVLAPAAASEALASDGYFELERSGHTASLRFKVPNQPEIILGSCVKL